jgi:NAD(P)-dependent dehydrogenase (short-subunit alcohol dehydrogenase family)
MRACIFGASGGIGRAVAKALAERHTESELFVGARSPEHLEAVPGTPFAFDLFDEASISAAAQALQPKGPFDLVFVATGALKQEDAFDPEKSWRTIHPDAMARVFAINTIGPALIGKHFLPLLARDRKSVFAALSARVGSITDNRLGGWHSYRASKAALNMILRNFALELSTRNPGAIVAGLHPGTVDTALSRPFQRNVAPGKLFSPAQSAGHMLAVLDRLTPDDSGKLFAWDGGVIPF